MDLFKVPIFLAQEDAAKLIRKYRRYSFLALIGSITFVVALAAIGIAIWYTPTPDGRIPISSGAVIAIGVAGVLGAIVMSISSSEADKVKQEIKADLMELAAQLGVDIKWLRDTTAEDVENLGKFQLANRVLDYVLFREKHKEAAEMHFNHQRLRDIFLQDAQEEQDALQEKVRILYEALLKFRLIEEGADERGIKKAEGSLKKR